MKTTELELSDGMRVLLRAVPPYAISDVFALFTEPSYPQVTLDSPAGAEQKAALPGTPEYEEYRESVRQHRRMVNKAAHDFTLLYGVVAWKAEGESTWQHEPPEDWEVPKLLVELGVCGAPRNRFDTLRLRYLKYEVVETDEDSDAIDAITRVPYQPLGGKEIADAMAPFDFETLAGDLSKLRQMLEESPTGPSSKTI